MTWSQPTPEQQIQFLRNIQRLLAEGRFVASYKFALVHALADLAVLHGDDTGRPLETSTRDIAAKFVELYWRQARPFQTGLILQQNTGRQAEIISKIAASQQDCGGSLFRFKQTATDRWSSLVGEVDQVGTFPKGVAAAGVEEHGDSWFHRPRERYHRERDG